MSNVFGGDEVNALVLDIGTCLVKAGYAGDDVPKAVFPSAAGVIAAGKENGAGAGVWPSGRKLYVGQSGVNYRRDNMEVASPYNLSNNQPSSDGFADWEIVEAILDHAFRDRLSTDLSEYALMMAEPNAMPKRAREQAAELLFEKHKPPALFLAKNAVLSTFAHAKQSALVVDAGHYEITATAVHDGYLLSKTLAKSPVGGHLLNLAMQKAVECKGIQFKPRFSFKRFENSQGKLEVQDLPVAATTSFRNYQVEALAGDVREALCRVSDLPFDETASANVPTVAYELPDGTEISIGPDRFKIPELTFNPSLLPTFPLLTADLIPRRPDGSLPSSLTDLVSESLLKCDVDLRKELAQGVLLTGGLSLTPGMRDRLEKELAERHQALKFKVLMPANPLERRFSTWIGGSILASLGSFQQLWMSRKEYEEHGASLIHRKCP
mmetsp:Transcript_14127/g.38206  ORF Transcript_14127/g.38206 Transcript_14127/m.38206 type:complete len:438 (+) Transcript_14127:3436-4749(+)